MAGRELTVSQVMAEIEKDTAFYDESAGGVTFSGGEPLAQPDFLFALLKACKDRQMHTVLDTSGFSTWSVLDLIRHHVDEFLFDLKLMDDRKASDDYRRIQPADSGKSPGAVLRGSPDPHPASGRSRNNG